MAIKKAANGMVDEKFLHEYLALDQQIKAMTQQKEAMRILILAHIKRAGEQMCEGYAFVTEKNYKYVYNPDNKEAAELIGMEAMFKARCKAWEAKVKNNRDLCQEVDKLVVRKKGA